MRTYPSPAQGYLGEVLSNHFEYLAGLTVQVCRHRVHGHPVGGLCRNQWGLRALSVPEVGDQAIGDGRDAVQRLRAAPPEDCDLATSLMGLGAKLGAGFDSPSKPEYCMVAEARSRKLTAVVRDEVYRVARRRSMDRRREASGYLVE